jgi:hypothetical protein
VEELSPLLVATFWMASLAFSVFQGLYYGIRTALYMDITTPAVAANTAWVSVLGKLANLGNIDFNPSATQVIHNTGPAGSAGGVDTPIAANDPRVSASQLKVYAYGLDTLLTLPNIDLNNLPTSLATDIPALLHTIADLLRGKVLGQSLPLIGNALRDVSTSLFGDAADSIADALDSAGTLSPAAVKQAFYDALGPSGLAALGDWDGINPASPDANDVQIIQDAQHVQFNLRLKKHVADDVSLDTNFGFPGLGLHLKNSKIEAFADYDVLLRFGVSKTQGLYIDASDFYQPADAATRGGDEVILSSGVALTSLNAEGSLGFLVLTMTPGTPNGGGANQLAGQSRPMPRRMFQEQSPDLGQVLRTQMSSLDERFGQHPGLG